MKKYAVERLTVEIGRWCNMTCDHCLKGEREKLAIRPEYFNTFLDNITIVNILDFIGGESVFYIKEMRKILEIFKKKNVSINYVRVHSNILIRSEEFVSFMNEIGLYSNHPENVKLFISKDKFHLKNMEEMGINIERYEETKEWYRSRLSDNIILRENNDPEWRLLLEGRAKDIPKELLRNYLTDEFDYAAYKNTPIIIDTVTNEEKGTILENAFKNLVVSAEGYLFTTYDFSYDTERHNNHELSLGFVEDETLENMIIKWNNRINEKNEKPILSIVNEGFRRYITNSKLFEDEIRKAVYSEDEEALLKIKSNVEKEIESFKKDLDFDIENRNYDVENNMMLHSLMAISTTLKLIDTLLDIPNGIFRKLGMKTVDMYSK